MKKMMMLALCLSSFAMLSFAETVTLTAPMWVGGKELKAGDYNVEMHEGKVVFWHGKEEVASAPAAVETLHEKNLHTMVHGADSKISEILLGGTATKIVVHAEAAHH